MKRASGGSSLGAQTAQTASIPSPFGGLNAKDSIALMPPTDAVMLDNLFPEPTGCGMRKGSVNWVTGFSAPVESLMGYRSASSSKLWAAAGAGIYDATLTGAVGAQAVSGNSNARFVHVNFGTPGGQFLYCVNGANTLLYNGSNWQRVTNGTGATMTSLTAVGTLCTAVTSTAHGMITGQQIVVIGCTPAAYNGTFSVTVVDSVTFTYVALSAPGGAAAPIGTYSHVIAITGVDPATFVSVNSHQNRLWFTQASSAKVWYLPVQSVGGLASGLDFSSQFKLGGTLQGMVTWTVDNTAGLQDYAVFVSSEGEVLVYGGVDPSSTVTWQKVGQFRMGRPLGRRFACKVGSDIAIIGADGFYPLHQSLLVDRSQIKISISDKIQTAIGNDILEHGNNFGWQAILHPIGSKIFLNVPTSENSAQFQYVLNTTTNAWCRYTGWNANCFELLNDVIYYGGNLISGSAAVVKCETGTDDNGAEITAQVQQAFSYFSDSASGLGLRQKQFKMLRPIFRSEGGISPSIAVNTDFELSSTTQNPTYTSPITNLWDVTPWDVVKWSTDAQILRQWLSCSGLGYSAGVNMKITAKGFTVKWLSTDFLFDAGGVL